MFGKSKISIIKSAYSIKLNKMYRYKNVGNRFDFDFRMGIFIYDFGLGSKTVSIH